jgi:glyoxylase-like metal-dependent hydrolase (beta-lactamase superfamily II)
MAWQGRRIGEISIVRALEIVSPFDPLVFFPETTHADWAAHESWLKPRAMDPKSGALLFPVQSYLLRTAHHTILIDSCVGNDKERPNRPFWHRKSDDTYMRALAGLGVAPEQIDYVLCTHLHVDHVGWNTRLVDGRWVPTFPNAIYLFSRTENEYGDPGRNPVADADPQRGIAYRDSVLPVIEAGQAVLLDGTHAIDDAMVVEPAPGHTPGHVILKLDDRGQRALFCGDALHHPLQVYAPHWNSRFCEIPAQALVTRRRVLEHCAEQGALLFPIHFGAPHVGAITADAAAFSLRFVDGRGP